MMRSIMSGIQPTGIPHIGNYFGAIRNWLKLQAELTDCLSTRMAIMIADIHALSNLEMIKSRSLRGRSLDTAAILLSCGINPALVTFYKQSEVPAHLELNVILSNFVTLAKLKQIPTYKETMFDDFKEKGTISAGRFGYPILQASDILLHKATHVPVGEDQIAHIEICRYIARKFNNVSQTSTFQEPNAVLDSITPRIRSLRDPFKKMSKSDPNPMSYVSLLDDNHTIRRKISQALTDSCWPQYCEYDWYKRPAISSLLDLVLALRRLKECDCNMDDVLSDVKHLDYKSLKTDVIVPMLTALIEPIREKFQSIRHDKSLELILENGAVKAKQTAVSTLTMVKEAIGL